MQTSAEGRHRTSPTLLLCIPLILIAGCYTKMYDEPPVDKAQTALLRGPIGPGFPMQLTIGDREKPKGTTRIPAGRYTLGVKWIGEMKAPPDFMKGQLLRVPYQCSMSCDLKAGKKYDVTVVDQKVSLYEYDVTRLTGTRKDGRVVESCEGAYVGCCP